MHFRSPDGRLFIEHDWPSTEINFYQVAALDLPTHISASASYHSRLLHELHATHLMSGKFVETDTTSRAIVVHSQLIVIENSAIVVVWSKEEVGVV